MKSSKTGKSKRSAAAVAAITPPPKQLLWPYMAALAVAFFAVMQVYWAVMPGPFLLDDTYLPYMIPSFANLPFRAWVSGVRPVLMLTYWFNFQHAGNEDAFAYHMVNVFIHFFNGILIYLAVRKVLGWLHTEKWHTEILSGFAAGVFLLHPLQTESVSYITSRSETLSVFFVLAAYVVFLYRKSAAASWGTALGVLALFGAAVLSKEHTAVFPALLLLTDYYWNPGFAFQGIKRNWRLYLPIVAGGALGFAFVWRVLTQAASAGFHMKDLTWYQYFFSQCRVIWDYVRLYLLPFGQNVDYDYPISHTVTEHGAIVGLIGLVAISVLAWIYRRKFPLGSYGWFVFLLLLAPTSSFVPIRDLIAERRMYLPFIGLLFMTLEFVRRWKVSRTALLTILSVVLLVEAFLTYQRNQLLTAAIPLWKDSVSKSPNKTRPRFQLAYAYYQAQQYSESIGEYSKLAQLEKPNFDLLIDWALAYDGAARYDEAIEKLKQAAAIEPGAHVNSQLGIEYAKQGNYAEALDALATAIRVDPSFMGGISFFTRGNVYAKLNRNAEAAEDYRRAIAFDPHNQTYREALSRVNQ